MGEPGGKSRRWGGPVAMSVRIYKVLVRAYPAPFRLEYGDEMAHIFGELAADAVRRGGTAGLVATWFRVLGDLARTVPHEHYRDLRRRFEMKTALFAVFSVLVSAIVYNFALALVGIVTVCTLVAISLWTTGSCYSMLAPGANAAGEWTLIYLPALATGMLLVRAKPFFKPTVTAPLGVMAYWTLALCLGSSPPGWGAVAVQIVFIASIGLVALLGAVVGVKISARFFKPCAS